MILRFKFVYLLLAIVALTQAKVIDINAKQNLQDAINKATAGDTLELSEGKWEATAKAYHDSTCGNCTDANEGAKATVGFTVDKSLTLHGAGASRSLLVTNAGYGLLIEGGTYSNVILRGIGITGGKRDPDGRATDAAIVVRRGTVVIDSCRIFDNTHRVDSVVVGIAGVVGREKGTIQIQASRIENNGWDGIALYRGAVLRAYDVVIRKGRGAGIGITWDSKANINKVQVSEYWKGIGTFGESMALIYNSVVRDNEGWGIIATGTSKLWAENCAVMHNGNCGLAMWSDSANAQFNGNLVVGNGWKKQWVAPRVGFWRVGDGKTTLSNNLFWANDSGDVEGVTLSQFDSTNAAGGKIPGTNISVSGNLRTNPGSIDSLGFPTDPANWEFREKGVRGSGIGPAYQAKPMMPVSKPKH